MTSSTASLEAAIKRLLLEEWDPIGVKNFPEAQNEYDSYVEGICNLLKNGASTDDIFKYLDWIELDRMGLDRNELRTREIAARLSKLRVQDY